MQIKQKEHVVQKFIVVLLAGLSLVLVACGTGQPSRSELPTDPQALLEEVVVNMQAVDTFRMTIEQSGPPYPILLSFDGTSVIQAELRRGTAQFISPNELFINVNVKIGVVVSVDVFSLDDLQWASFPSGAPWYQLPPFPDFDISRLMAKDDGMEYAMTNLENVNIIGEETLIDGSTAIHIQANATGEVVRGLLFGLIEPEDDVQVDVYINPADSRFALVEVTMLETITEDSAERSVWRIEFYDYNAPQDFDVPQQARAEATEELKR
jgi:LppX_LprAFG lipoprotein